MMVEQRSSEWVVVADGEAVRTFPTNAEAWRWVDRQLGEPISRSEAVSEWIWSKIVERP